MQISVKDILQKLVAVILTLSLIKTGDNKIGSVGILHFSKSKWSKLQQVYLSIITLIQQIIL